MAQFVSVSKTKSLTHLISDGLVLKLLSFDLIVSAPDYDASIRPGPSSGLTIDCMPALIEVLQVLKHCSGINCFDALRSRKKTSA